MGRNHDQHPGPPTAKSPAPLHPLARLRTPNRRSHCGHQFPTSNLAPRHGRRTLSCFAAHEAWIRRIDIYVATWELALGWRGRWVGMPSTTPGLSGTMDEHRRARDVYTYPSVPTRDSCKETDAKAGFFSMSAMIGYTWDRFGVIDLLGYLPTYLPRKWSSMVRWIWVGNGMIPEPPSGRPKSVLCQAGHMYMQLATSLRSWTTAGSTVVVLILPSGLPSWRRE